MNGRPGMPSLGGGRVLLGGHRGDRAHCPENTMASFRAAVELGIDAIETDVRMTRDGHLVLIHDREVDRTTNGTGRVDEMTLSEIKALDAGSWKDPRFTGEKIPTAEEFLDLMAGNDLLINWELKEYPRDFGEDRARATVDRLVGLIDRFGVADRSILNSYSDRLLEYAADRWPGKFALHGYPHYRSPKDVPEKPLLSFLDWAVIWDRAEDHPAGLARDYAEAKAAGLRCCILVHDVEEEYRAALALGCDMFTSDDPSTAKEFLKRLLK